VGAKATLLALCGLADSTLKRVLQDALKLHDSAADGLSLLALGGYGRRMLFPFSDLDILFLSANEKREEEFRPLIPNFRGRCGTWISRELGGTHDRRV